MKFRLSKKIAIWGVFVFIAIFFSFKFLLINSEACRVSIECIINNESVHEYLGDNIATGFWITGSVNYMGERSVGRFVIPVQGSKGSGRAEVEANKRTGDWQVVRLELILSSGKKLRLK